ncbi:MAG: ORF6N domain-containing protein [Candidatus Margulisbacteria bacterium]|nr:ORF6N domain-containing protein [Candidatus Margulisiibacteriota bacterium]
MKKSEALVTTEVIENRIFLLRGKKVMLDRDLASLYGVETKQLKRAVNRNKVRFPADFMFVLTKQEAQNSRCQIGTLKNSQGSNIKYLPYAFTEHGILMLSSVLNSARAVSVNIQIMRIFVKLRKAIITHKNLQRKIAVIIRHQHSQDQKISSVVEVINKFFAPEKESPQKQWGFLPPTKKNQTGK